VRQLCRVVFVLAVLPAVGAAQDAAPLGADVRIVTTSGRVIRGRLVQEDAATMAIRRSDARATAAFFVTPRDSIALLEVRAPGHLRPEFVLMGGAAGAAGGAMLGATVAWMECPLGESLWCSARGRRNQMRAITTGMEIGVVGGLVAGFLYRPSRWRAVPTERIRPAIVGLRRGVGVGVELRLWPVRP
jgi:hypothetical protein